jgi:prefoldin subunit 5
VLKKLLNLFKRKTVSGVLAAFEKAIENLEHVAQYQHARRAQLHQEIAKLADEHEKSSSEAQRAEAAALNFRMLVNKS